MGKYQTGNCPRKDCVYRDYLGSCCYSLITGCCKINIPNHSGPNCVLYKSGKVRRCGASFNNDLAYNLWKQGKNDREIGEVLHISQTSVFNWRRRKGLAAVKKTAGRKRTWDTDKARELADQGATNQQIAEACGTKVWTVQAWKRETGLNQAPGKAEKPGKKLRWDPEEGTRLYRAGATVAEVAERYGVTESAVRNWFCRHGVRKN